VIGDILALGMIGEVHEMYNKIDKMRLGGFGVVGVWWRKDYGILAFCLGESDCGLFVLRSLMRLGFRAPHHTMVASPSFYANYSVLDRCKWSACYLYVFCYYERGGEERKSGFWDAFLEVSGTGYFHFV
jgi:hypothetical protein